MQKRLLQFCIGVGGLVPVSAGLFGIIQGTALLDVAPANAALDSHFRYLSGLLLGIGLGFWSTIFRLERSATSLFVLTFVVVTGGLGRLAGMVGSGLPPASMLAALVMELVVTPALFLWWRRLFEQR